MKNKRTFVVGGIILGVVLVAAISYAVWALLLAPPSKDDYKKAAASGEKIITYNGLQLMREFNAKAVAESRKGSTYDTIQKAASAERKKTLDAVDTRAKLGKELGEGRVTRDDEVKKAYDTYYSREVRYGNYIRDYTQYFPYYLSSFNTCIDIYSIIKNAEQNEVASAHKKASEDCLKDLNSLSKSPITPLADYAKEFIRIIGERQKLYDELSSNKKSITDITPRLEELSNDAAKNNPTAATRKYGEDAVFNGQLSTLVDLLKKKAEA